MQEQDFAYKKRKRNLFVLCTSITIAAFAILTTLNYIERDIPEVLLNLLVIVLMIIGLAAITKWQKDLLVYRIFHFWVSVICFYGVAYGTGRETVLYWVLIMPLMFFNFFGKSEGLIWTVVFSLSTFLIVLTAPLTGAHVYSAALIPRYAVILLLLIVLGYGQEASRDAYSRLLYKRNEDLRLKKERLEKALGEIKTLSGLIPICCNCKKIRNDEGYWQQVEIYVQERTLADFSHGICPECFEKLYPGYPLSKKARKAATGQSSPSAAESDPHL